MKRAAIALSIANLCFVFLWHEILLFATQHIYFFNEPPDRQIPWAIVVDVLVLAAIIFALLLIRGGGSRPLRTLAIIPLTAVTLFAALQICLLIKQLLQGALSRALILPAEATGAAVVVLLLARSPKRVLPILRTAFLILCPLFLVFVAQSFWVYDIAGAHFGPGEAASMLLARSSHNRVIWIIFDELDYRLSFPARPARIQLPNFDALRRTSVFADHVKSPAHNTIAAMLSLLLAKDIPTNEDVKFQSSRHLRVRFTGCSQFAGIHSEPNVFHRARALGFNTAVSGWYQPYCRLFGNDLSACATQYGGRNAVGVQKFLRPRPLWKKALFLARWQGRAVGLHIKADVLRSGINWRILSIPERAYMNRRLHIARLRSELQHGLLMLQNPQLNFVLLHFSVPHPPGIWDSRAQSFTTSEKSNYIDNLMLADYVLGKVRKTLEQTGSWDRSTILISADHPYRTKLWLYPSAPPPQASPSPEMLRDTHRTWQPYIPFILKLPDQKAGIEYHREFNSVLSAHLLLAALQEKIQTPAQAVKWLDTHAAMSQEKVCR